MLYSQSYGPLDVLAGSHDVDESRVSRTARFVNLPGDIDVESTAQVKRHRPELNHRVLGTTSKRSGTEEGERMHCSNCGSELQQGAVVCNSCGSGVVRVAARTSSVRRCPRCGYWGGGVKYFSRLGHLAVLAGLSLFTYTIGGLTYWLVCRKRLVCPNCGFGWENSTRMLEAPKSASSAMPTTVMTADAGAALMQSDEVLPSKGLGRRVGGVGAILMATLMILIGIVEFEAAPIVIGGVLGMGGSLNFLWGWKALQERRKAVMRGLERRILKLATARGGALTVTDVAAELDLSLEASEKLLNEMEDGFRIISDVTDAGIIVYEFPEVQHRPQFPPSGPGKKAPPKPV